MNKTLVLVGLLLVCACGTEEEAFVYRCDGNYQDSWDQCQEYGSVSDDMIIIGDSAFVPYDTCQGLPGQLSRILGEQVISLAEGGATINRIRYQYLVANWEMPNLKTVILDGGAMDVLAGTDSMLVGFAQWDLLKLILSNGHTPIMMTLYPPVSGGPHSDMLGEYFWYGIYQKSNCEALGVLCYDPSYDFNMHPCPMAMDGIHPNQSGHQVIAEGIAELL